MLVNIDVDDLERAVDFYARAFGLRVARRLGGSVVEMLGAAAPIYLLAKPDGSDACADSSLRRDYRRHWTPVHLDFAVADLDAEVTRVQDAGATCEGAVEMHAWGRIAYFSDPFGHGFCLVELGDRGYDAIADS